MEGRREGGGRGGRGEFTAALFLVRRSEKKPMHTMPDEIAILDTRPLLRPARDFINTRASSHVDTKRAIFRRARLAEIARVSTDDITGNSPRRPLHTREICYEDIVIVWQPYACNYRVAAPSRGVCVCVKLHTHAPRSGSVYLRFSSKPSATSCNEIVFVVQILLSL